GGGPSRYSFDACLPGEPLARAYIFHLALPPVSLVGEIEMRDCAIALTISASSRWLFSLGRNWRTSAWRLAEEQRSSINPTRVSDLVRRRVPQSACTAVRCVHSDYRTSSASRPSCHAGPALWPGSAHHQQQARAQGNFERRPRLLAHACRLLWRERRDRQSRRWP